MIRPPELVKSVFSMGTIDGLDGALSLERSNDL